MRVRDGEGQIILVKMTDKREEIYEIYERGICRFFFLVVASDVTDETRAWAGGPLLKSPCWDLVELIRELEERGGRPRQKSPRRPAAAWRSRAGCHIAKLFLSPRGSGLIGSRVAYEEQPLTLPTHLPVYTPPL